MSTSNLPRGCDTSMWFHQCLHQKGKECVCDLVHARLICSHVTSAQAHPRSPKLHLFLSQTPLLTSIQLHLTLSSPLHPYLTPSSPVSLSHTCTCAYVHGLLHVSQLLTNPEVSGTKTTPLHAGIPLCVHSIHCHAQCIRYPTQVGGAWDPTQHIATPSNA